MITLTLVHLLYFSCSFFPICGVTAEHVQEGKPTSCGEGEGDMGGNKGEDGMMQPRWSLTDYLHGATAVFWEVIFEPQSPAEPQY